jgi:hypothetical protein
MQKSKKLKNKNKQFQEISYQKPKVILIFLIKI